MAARSSWKDQVIRVIFAIVNVLVYGIVYGGATVFTVLMLVIGPWTSWKVWMSVIYGLVGLAIVLGLTVPLIHPKFRYRPGSEKHPKP